MEALSARDYRRNIGASFDRAARGEQVLIRRKNQLYALTTIGTGENLISPALHKQMQSARKNYQRGNFVSCATPEDLDALLASL